MIIKNGLLMSQKAGPSWIPKFCCFLWTDDKDEGEDATLSCQAFPTLNEHQPPKVPGASPSSLLTSDSGSNQKPHRLWPNTHPLDHVGDRISSQMCVYIPQNVPKPQRNQHLKNQNFDPSRVRTLVRTLVAGVIDSDARHLNR
jgi:hypothetical protein